jgi:DNA-binding LacI/PurR family transcriptional regulator
MRDGISVITVPMSPTNNPDDILEKYLDIIPEKAKVICVGEWGVQGLECLKKRKCNVVFYDLQQVEHSELVDENWKKLVFDRAYGAYHAVEELAKNGFKKPLFLMAENEQSKAFAEKTIKALKAQEKYYPNLPQENILWYDESKFDEFIVKFSNYVQEIDFDSVFFSSVGYGDIILDLFKKKSNVGIISNDTTEIISTSGLSHYAADFEKLATMTVDLFNQPENTIQTIKPKLYNKTALMNKKEMV